jgi:ATP-dependent helicase/nuclease subunit B
LPTERHVERALAEGVFARTWRAFVDDHAAASGLCAANPEMTRLATAATLAAIEHPFGPGAAPAIVATLDAALGVLGEAGVDAAALGRANGGRSALFARLLEGTAEHLTRAGAYDRRSAGFLAARAIERAPIEDLPPNVVVEGLLDWTAADHAWVEALSRRVRVTVRMPRWAGAPGAVTGSTDVLLSALEERWQGHSRGPELELVDIALPAEIELVASPSDAAEARAIAGALRRALSSGVAASDIAVVLPSLDESFLEPLRAALDEARIAFAEPRGRPPIATPLVRAALAWLEIAAGPLARDALVDLLRTSVIDPAPFVEGPTAPARREHARQLARRLTRIPVGVDRDGTLLSDLLASDTATANEPWLLASLDKILAARRALQTDAPRRALAAQLLEVWTSMGLGPVSLGVVSDLVEIEDGALGLAAEARAVGEDVDRKARLLRALAREQSAGHTALMAAIERVLEAAQRLGMGDEPVSIERLRAELEEALMGAPPLGTHRPGAVRIARAADVAFLPCECLIVARASEGVFESAPTANGVFGEELLNALPRRQRPPSAMAALAAGRTALLAAAARAERIVLTRSTTDGDGRPAAPSPFFAELAAGRSIEDGPSSVLDPSREPLSPRAEELVALSLGRPAEDADVARRVAIEKARLEFFLDPRLAPSPATGAIDVGDAEFAAHLARAIGGTVERPIAATAIERAASCRFAAFARGVLGATQSDSTGEELEPWQRGSLVHRALQVALEATRPRWNDLPRDELFAVGMTAARRAMLRDRTAPLYRAETERALRDVEAVLAWSLDDTSWFRFAYSERSFGETRDPRTEIGGKNRAAWPALATGDGRDSVFVKGRIDRIDLAQGGGRARVIDYKTGALPAWKDVGTLVFQPPLYALALFMQLGPLSLPEVRALYLDTSKRPPRVFPAEKSQVLSPEVMAAAQRRAKEIVQRMRAGDVAPRPADALVCGRCSVRDVCRRPAAMPIDDQDLEVEGGAS